MRVLWLSNKILSDSDNGSTGTWLDAMARRLSNSGDIELGNISTARVNKCIRKDSGIVRQWAVPRAIRLDRHGMPPGRIISDIVKAVDEFSPDLIHVWGSENYWGLLTARKIIKTASLLEMQGLKLAIARVFHGGLSMREQVSCTGLKEVVRGSTIWQCQKRFKLWEAAEKEIVLRHKYIAVQTTWIESQIKSINPGSNTFHTGRIIREQFYDAVPWRPVNEPIVFCSAAYPSPFKGLHIAIRAVALLKNRYPKIRLRIAGLLLKRGLRQEGYIKWVLKESRRLGIDENIDWLGPLNAQQIVSEMHNSSAMVIPSFIENCSTSMQEAMMIGLPLVVSYAGGLPSLAEDEKSALFFPYGDDAMCAYQLERVLFRRELALSLSEEARKIASDRNNRDRVVANQQDIYRRVLDSVDEQRKPTERN